jgi:sarcosine oxidase
VTDRATAVDLVVVGGGARGLATAWHAAAAGTVVLLERFALGHDRGASHGGERIFRHAYTDRAYVDMALAAEDGWAELGRLAGHRLIHRVGCVEHGPGTEIDALAATSAAAGVVTERLSAREAERRWPALRFAGDVLAQPTAGWVRAADGVAALARGARLRGAVLHDRTPVAAIEPRGGPGDGAEGVRVTAADGRAWEAPVAVVAAGAWAATLLPGLGWPPLLTTEENVFFFRPRGEPGAPSLPAFIHWEGLDRYGLPGPEGLVKVGEHHAGVPTTGDTRSGVPDPARRARVERYVAEWVPGLVPEAVAASTCLYTTTPTQDFVLDRVGPLVVATGFSGHGFKFVPEVGRRLAALAAGTEAPMPPFTLASHARR